MDLKYFKTRIEGVNGCLYGRISKRESSSEVSSSRLLEGVESYYWDYKRKKEVLQGMN